MSSTASLIPSFGRIGRFSSSFLLVAIGLAWDLPADAAERVPGPASRGSVPLASGPLATARKSPDEVRTALTALAGRHFLIQLNGPATDALRRDLEAGGITLLSYVGDNAFFATAAASRLNAGRLAGLGIVRDALAIDRPWKLHRDIRADAWPPWAIVRTGEAETPKTVEPSLKPVQPKALETTVAAYVLFHPDVALESVGTRIAREHQAAVRSRLRSLNALVVEMPLEQVAALADRDQVQWIEPPLPAFSELNSSNRARVQADILQAAPYGLDGAGVSVLVYDGGFGRSSHTDFGGRHTTRDTAGLSDHATHVAGTVGGSGAASGGANRGMAPGVTIESYGFEVVGGLQPGFLYTDPGDLEADYTEAINTFGTDISNNSIGSNVEPNGFPCAWQGDYGLTSSLIDGIVRGSVSGGTPFRIVWAAGNERQGSSCDIEGFGDYFSLAPPSAAKNHISVGALNSNDDSMTSFSSWGPSDDGRMKPDIAGPGCQSGGDNGVTSCGSGSDTAYTVKCGTSMSSPTVCGISALILQDFRVQFPGEPDFRNSTLKALLAHTAVDLGNPGPDYQFGYGSVRAQDAIDFMRTGNFFENEVAQGQAYQVIVIVGPADTELKVTMAWDDAPATPNASPVLVNDLDLVVFDPSNNQHFAWTLNPAAPSAAAVQTTENRLDNMEQVFVSAPAAGAWRVEVRGFNVPQGPQPFSLCASPLLVNCSSQGIVALDRNKYRCTDTAVVRVVDCDLNTDDGTIQTVTVNVASTTIPAGKSVLLTETSPESATFLGSINLVPGPSFTNLRVSPGDTVTATYVDADDGLGGMNIQVTDLATVDCTAPVISNVQVINLEPRSATITFTTDEPASGQVRFGTACGTLSTTAPGSGLQTSHSINLTGLIDDTTYFFAVDAADEAGNAATDDNSGACHTFTTPEVPDFFTEMFESSDNDLDNLSIEFAPAANVDEYTACTTPISALPVDPVGGTTLSLGDDSPSSLVTLGGGAQVILYGTSYSSFWVNPNGHLTMTTADGDTTETFADHFNRPRVSALFDDLNPTQGGTVSWKQLSDRVAVTWQNIPEHNGGNQNTFQVVLFFDGRIQLNYLAIAAVDGLAGLSEGAGLSPDFFESDLSSHADCGPRPPTASSASVTAARDTEATLTLIASDDGTPNPLTYIIMSLPAQELRDAGDDHVIAPGDLPYTLVGGGNQVIYAPTGGFTGSDSFQFKVNDGGTPPDGGDSNVATISLFVEPVLPLPFFDDFPTPTFDPLKWSLTDATIDGVGLAEPSPPLAARFNGDPDGADEIRTQLIDLSGGDPVRLTYSFQQTGGGESADAADDLFVEYLDNVGAWQVLGTHLGSGPDMTTFQTVEILLPAPALHVGFRLRFRNTATSGAFDDWFVDDVSLTVANAPTAANVMTSTDIGTPKNITLNANDPNMDPLTYTILSLPSDGTLSDPGAGAIGSVPYVLVGGGNMVTYTPTGPFSGIDSFTYRASDGVFDSNTATVTVEVVPVLNLPFTDDFPAASFDAGKWAVVTGATIDGVGMAEPSAPNSARFNGDPAANDEIRTHVIDLDGQTAVRLTYWFQQRGGGESPDSGDDLFVEYLNASAAWVVINQHLGSGPDMTTYQQVETLLPAGAMHGAFRLRIRCTATSGLFDDWFVDDITIADANTPVAQDGSALAGLNQTVSIDLQATDANGDTLTYRIESLPANGSLADPNGGDITTVPYDLLSNGDDIDFTPAPWFQGGDSFTFSASDGTNTSNVATISLTVGGNQPAHVFPLDTDPGWTTMGQWQFGQPTGGGSSNHDPLGGFTGTNVYGYNLAGDYPNNLTPTQYLTTTAIDCSMLSQSELRFRRWLGIESATFDHANVQISTNGTTWTTLWDHTGVAVAETSWSLQTFNIASIADGQPTVFLRWGMGTTDGSVTYPGWNIDDIEIWAVAENPCFGTLPGDVTLNGDRDGDDINSFVDVLMNPGGATPDEACAADVDLSGGVDTADVGPMIDVLLNP